MCKILCYGRSSFFSVTEAVPWNTHTYIKAVEIARPRSREWTVSSLHVLYILKALRKEEGEEPLFFKLSFFHKISKWGKRGEVDGRQGRTTIVCIYACSTDFKSRKEGIATFEDFPFSLWDSAAENSSESVNLTVCTISTHFLWNVKAFFKRARDFLSSDFLNSPLFYWIPVKRWISHLLLCGASFWKKESILLSPASSRPALRMLNF